MMITSQPIEKTIDVTNKNIRGMLIFANVYREGFL